MPNMSTEKIDTIFALFKGEPGTRKSTQAMSFPTPQYWFSVDKKMTSLILPGKNWGTDFSKIEYDHYSPLDAAKNANMILDKIEKLRLKCPYKTIILDSITTSADLVNMQVINLKSGTTDKDGKEKGNRVGGINVNTLEDYKAENSFFTQAIAGLKDIEEFHGCNVILIGHIVGERSIKDRAGITHMSRILVTGGKAISGKIPAYCKETYHFNIEPGVAASDPGKYGLLTVHTGDDYARTELPLPRSIIFNNDPLYEKYIMPAMKQLNEQKAVTKL